MLRAKLLSQGMGFLCGFGVKDKLEQTAAIAQIDKD
jgi:hypothetical protein